MRSRSLVGGVVLAAIASPLLASVPASAVVLPPVVDDDGLAAVGDCDAVTPAHPTIQAAVTAAGSYNTGGPVLLGSAPQWFSDDTHHDHVHAGFAA